MKTKLLLIIMFAANIGNAQAPWRAKLFVHFLDSSNQIVTDTVWFGCDSLGAIGFQPGLDLMETNLQWNKVYGSDDLIKTQFNTDCGNLKTNVIGFKSNYSTFSFVATGNPISISWDTLDYIYQPDSQFRLSSILIRSKSGYIRAYDLTDFFIGGDIYTLINNKFIYQGFSFNPSPVEIIPESKPNNCGNPLFTFAFDVKINLGWFNGTGMLTNRLINQTKVYPNPVKDILNIDFNNSFSGTIHVTNLIGIKMYDANIINSQNEEINLSNLANGIYYLTVLDKNNQVTTTQKIIIQH